MVRSIRILPRLLAIATVLAILAIGTRDTVGNQTGPGIGDRVGNLNGLCRLNGGTSPPTTSIDTVKERWACIGGALDGLYCDVYADLTYCYWENVGKGVKPLEVTVDVPTLTFVSELPPDAANPLVSGVASQPMLVEAVITWNPTTEAVTAASLEQVNACRHLGGVETVAHPGGDPASVTIQCSGGLLDGHWCAFGLGPSTCFFVPEATAPATMPPTEAPPPTSAATPTASTPTEAPPTSEPPTDEPVIEPTFVDPTADDPWSLPEGTLVPFEPVTPTPLPLT